MQRTVNARRDIATPDVVHIREWTEKQALPQSRATCNPFSNYKFLAVQNDKASHALVGDKIIFDCDSKTMHAKLHQVFECLDNHNKPLHTHVLMEHNLTMIIFAQLLKWRSNCGGVRGILFRSFERREIVALPQ